MAVVILRFHRCLGTIAPTLARIIHRPSWRSGGSAGGTRRRDRDPRRRTHAVRSVPRFIDMVTFADGFCETRSRSEEEAMQGHRRRRGTQRSPAIPISPKGGGGTALISLSLLLRDTHWHRVVVASRTRRRRATTNVTISMKRGTRKAGGTRLRVAQRSPDG